MLEITCCPFFCYVCPCCVPPTPGSELKKIMQEKEEKMRAGGRENWPIKIIEMAGRTLEQTLVKSQLVYLPG